MTIAGAPACAGAEVAKAPPPRLFVGLKIAPPIAEKLAGFAAALQEPSVRPVASVDIHLTLVPPWSEPSTSDAIEKLGGVAAKFAAFALSFQHVGYGPHPHRPRLLWVDCAAGEEITALRATLLQAFGQTDERPFLPHVTLARIRGDGRTVARKHPVDRQLSLVQRVETVELYQSPPAGARGYRILASPRLGRAAGPAPPPQ